MAFCALSGMTALWLSYAVVIFTVAAHFGASPFIETNLRHQPGIAPSVVEVLQIAFDTRGWRAMFWPGSRSIDISIR